MTPRAHEFESTHMGWRASRWSVLALCCQSHRLRSKPVAAAGESRPTAASSDSSCSAQLTSMSPRPAWSQPLGTAPSSTPATPWCWPRVGVWPTGSLTNRNASSASVKSPRRRILATGSSVAHARVAARPSAYAATKRWFAACSLPQTGHAVLSRHERADFERANIWQYEVRRRTVSARQRSLRNDT